MRVLLVDTMGGLGDLLLALPLVDALLRSHPEAELTVVTTAPWHALLERDGRIHRVVPVHGRSEEAVLSSVRAVLAEGRFALAVTTNRQHGLPTLLAEGAERAITDLWRSPRPDELVDRRMLRLLVEEGVVEPQFGTLPPRVVLGDDERADGRRTLNGLTRARPVLLFPDSGMRVKHWPLASWLETVEGVLRRGSVPIVVTQQEEQRAALAAAGALAAPPLPIRGLAAMCAAAVERDGRGIGGDTGPVRLASAVGLPVVGLFGPTVASRYGYRAAGAVNLQGEPGCPVRLPTAITEQECWWSARCPLTADHSPRCMAAIESATVLSALAG